MDRLFTQFTACMTLHAKVALVVLAAGCFGAAALGCVIASVWIFAIPLVGAGGAPLVAAVPLAILCLVGCLVARRSLQPSTPPVAPDTTVMAVAAATRLAREQPATALVVALIAGVLAGITRPK